MLSNLRTARQFHRTTWALWCLPFAASHLVPTAFALHVWQPTKPQADGLEEKFGMGEALHVCIQCLANVFISVEVHILSCSEDELQCIYWDLMSYDDLRRLSDNVNEELYILEKSRVGS